MEVFEGNQAVEISKLKEKVKRLDGELKSCNQGIETLMVEMADLIHQVMHWEAEALAPRISLKRLSLRRA